MAPPSASGVNVFEGAKRDQPVQFMNYRRPLVQESRTLVSETAATAAASQAALARASSVPISMMHDSGNSTKVQAYMESKSTGAFVKLSKAELDDMESGRVGADALNVESLPTLDGPDEVQTANLVC